MNIFFPKRMKDLTVIVHGDYTDRVIDAIHEYGKIQVSSVERDTDINEHIKPGSIPEQARTLTEYEMKMSEVLDILQKLPGEEEGLMDMLKPEIISRVKREDKGTDELLAEVDELLEGSVAKIHDMDQRVNEIESELIELSTLKRELEFLGDIDLDLSQVGESDYTVVRVGSIGDPLKLKKAFSGLDNTFLRVEPRGDEDENLFVAGAYIRDKAAFEGALREGDARTLDLRAMTGTPVKAARKLGLDIKELEGERDTLMDELAKARNEWVGRYNVLLEELEILKEKVEVYQSFGMTEHTAVIKAWCPDDEVERIVELTDKASGGCSVVTAEDPEDPDQVPVSLKNPFFIRPFELLTNMFAPPRYNEIDPTMILAPAFVIFFGLMLSDSVYGVVIILAALTMVWGPGRVDKGTKDFGYILLAAGISTIIFGIVQGGYMGPESADYLNLPGYLGLSSPAVINTLEGDGPLQLLIISLIIGLAYINIGMVLSFVQHIQRWDLRAVLLENISWWLLQPGGFILVGGEMFGWFDFSPGVVVLAWLMTGVGLILLLIRARGLSFFELTGFIGDFLSFARILALALATAGIALTVNVLTNLVGSGGGDTGYMLALPVLIGGASLMAAGAIKMRKRFLAPGIFLALAGGLGMVSAMYMFYMFALVVLLGGHLVNLVLQALGSFVHALRLQYVEFFGYFYEGGGTTFKPFKPKRKYTELISKQEVME